MGGLLSFILSPYTAVAVCQFVNKRICYVMLNSTVIKTTKYFSRVVQTRATVRPFATKFDCASPWTELRFQFMWAGTVKFRGERSNRCWVTAI